MGSYLNTQFSAKVRSILVISHQRFLYFSLCSTHWSLVGGAFLAYIIKLRRLYSLIYCLSVKLCLALMRHQNKCYESESALYGVWFVSKLAHIKNKRVYETRARRTVSASRKPSSRGCIPAPRTQMQTDRIDSCWCWLVIFNTHPIL